MATYIWGIVFVAFIIFLVFVLKRKILSLIVDILVGSALFFGIIFLVAFMGLKLPPLAVDYAYPIMLLSFTGIHIYNNVRSKAVKGLPHYSIWGS
jgi:hypothetical protein